jgi:hypothetical protein
VTLETPATDFLKGVNVEGSRDGRTWETVSSGQPIFRMRNGAGELHLVFPSGVWPWLRLTVDDQRTPPVPFTAARFQNATIEDAPVETQRVTITERNEAPGESRLTLALGAANLDVASLQIETDDPLFRRAVTFLAPQVAEDSIREQAIGQGVIYRVAVREQAVVANLTVPMETQVPARELVLIVHNEDSPPLSISGVSVQRRPVYLIFVARQAGRFQIVTGNKSCAAAHYDLAELGPSLKSAPLVTPSVSAVADNPDFRAPETLAGVDLTGAPLDVSDWLWRKSIQVVHDGVEQIELDPEVLARADAGFADLRILSGDKQVPYILERTSINRALRLNSTSTNDPHNPKISRWLLKLPRAGVPVTRLTCLARTPLFERSLSLYEERTNESGEIYRRALGSASWMRTPTRATNQFTLALGAAPTGDRLVLETENGDNPPIDLENFTAFYPATRALFKAKAGDGLYLYYGNSRVAPPRYDVSLVAGELLASDKATATLAAEQQVGKLSGGVNRLPASGGVVFWCVLAVVMVGLLAIIARLLPKAGPPA